MKSIALLFTLISSTVAYSATTSQIVQPYLDQAEQQKLQHDTTWQRLMYANEKGQSAVGYSGYFLAPEGQTQLKQELQANIQALFQSAEANQSVRCRFPNIFNTKTRLKSNNKYHEPNLPQPTICHASTWLGYSQIL